MRGSLEIERCDRGAGEDNVVLNLRGVMDASGGQRLSETCTPFKAHPRRVVLAMQDVTFISSSGIGILLALTEEFRDAGGWLRIVGPSKVTRMAIQLLNLESYLDMFESEDDALRRAA